MKFGEANNNYWAFNHIQHLFILFVYQEFLLWALSMPINSGLI